MGMSSTVCAKRAGISYRQFDHWCRNGFIPFAADDKAHTGSGVQRTISEEQAAFVIKLAKLVRAGIPVSAASTALQKCDDDVTVFHLTPEVRVELVPA